ncbi:MAG: uridine kinase, partial [Pseudomonadota bacterium]|nr:uridine kinase [Pseudomonadota bacterium]
MITKLIAITGASGSGKTYLADAIRQALAEQVPSDTIGLISEDSYYRNLDHLPMAERERVNYDHPDAFEHDLLLGQLRQIKSGLTAEV